MPKSTTTNLRNDTLAPMIDEGLKRAFQPILSERVPDRFHVLLDALSRKGSDHDHPERNPSR